MERNSSGIEDQRYPNVVSSPGFITGATLRKIATSLTVERSEEVAAVLNELLPKYLLDTADRFPEFIGRVCLESRNAFVKVNKEFGTFTENLNYRAKTLCLTWEKRFPTLESARPYEMQPKRLANKVYANRMGNGNEFTNDGWNFRGGGGIQITGRDLYTLYWKYLGDKTKTVEEVADLIRTDLWYALDSACWVFAINKHLLDEADNDEWVKINKAINGGTHGLKDATVYYELAKEAMLVAA